MKLKSDSIEKEKDLYGKEQKIERYSLY